MQMLSKKHYRKIKLLRRQKGKCGLCALPLNDNPNELVFRRIIPRSKGGTSNLNNLMVVHSNKICAIIRLDSGKGKKYLEQKGICAICDELLYDDLSMDHIIPKSKGGTNRFDNLQIVHSYCNSAKADRIESKEITKQYIINRRILMPKYPQLDKLYKKKLKHQYKSEQEKLNAAS